MIFTSPVVTAEELERATGWRLKAEGLCREDRCVPFAAGDPRQIALTDVATALAAPLVHDKVRSLWALGAGSGGHALTTATAADLELPDAEGRAFRLSSLRGQKVLLVAWASW